MSLLKRDSRTITYQQFWGTDPDQWDESIPWGSTYGGRLSTDQAMRLSAVKACLRIIANGVAMLPVDLYRDVGGGLLEALPKSELLRSPSTLVRRFDWIVQAVLSLMLDGNAYGYVTSRQNGWPTSIEWLDPRTVEVEQVGFRLVYKWGGVVVPTDDIVHIRDLVLPGQVKGVSVIEQNRDTIKLGSEAQKYALDFFLGGGHPTGVLETEQELKDGPAKSLKQRFMSATKRRGPVVLGYGTKYTRIQSIPDATTIEVWRMVKADIANVFGIDPENIGANGGSSMTYTNVEAKTNNLVTFGLAPVYTRLEEAFTDLHPRPQTVKFNPDGIVRTDLLTRYQAHEVGIRSKFLTPNEARALEDMPPLEGGDEFKDSPALVLTGPESNSQETLDIANALQKVYLAVTAGVLTEDEARELVNRLGAGLAIPGPTKPAPAPAPAAPIEGEPEA